MGEGVLQRALQLTRALHAAGPQSDRGGNVREPGMSSSVAKLTTPATFISSSTKFSLVAQGVYDWSLEARGQPEQVVVGACRTGAREDGHPLPGVWHGCGLAQRRLVGPGNGAGRAEADRRWGPGEEDLAGRHHDGVPSCVRRPPARPVPRCGAGTRRCPPPPRRRRGPAPAGASPESSPSRSRRRVSGRPCKDEHAAALSIEQPDDRMRVARACSYRHRPLVRTALAAAASAALYSCRTCTQSTSLSRRSASFNPLRESPGSP